MSNSKDPLNLGSMFWKHVQIGGLEECWPWLLAKSEWGYGRFGPARKRGKSVYAHRTSWELTRGEISLGLEVCHSCDNPSCCNPTHLWLGTHKENMLDQYLKGRGRVAEVPISGEDHYRSKLSNDQAREIMTDPRRQVDIAVEYGISQSQVSKIKLGHTRSHK